MKIGYWTTTILISVFLLWSAYSYLYSKPTIQGVRDLGFPDFFRIQLAIMKVLAVIVLLLPMVPLRFKEWAYVGAGLFFVTAIVAHVAHKDPVVISLINVLLVGLLVASYVLQHKLKAIA